MAYLTKAHLDGYGDDVCVWRNHYFDLPNPDPEYKESLSYGDLERAPASLDGLELSDLYIMPGLLSGSDYSGGTVTMSNCRVFLEDFGSRPGVYEVYGGHGTYAVAIRADHLIEEMHDTFRALDDYPLISEDDLSSLEIDLECEAWENWARSDFISELEKAFNADIEMEDDTAWELFRTAADKSNTYWEAETGGQMYVDIERIVKAIDTLPDAATVEYFETA